MKVLAIETSTDACSVALWIDGQTVNRHCVAPQRHAELVLAQIDEVLAETELSLRSVDRLAYGRGPGSFTGLRIAASVVQGLGFGAGLPIVPVSSLLAAAEGAFRCHGASAVLSVLDARRDEVYIGGYVRSAQRPQFDRWQVALPETVCAPQTLPEFSADTREQTWAGVGAGWVVYHELLKATLNAPSRAFCAQISQIFPLLPDAQDVATLAAAAPSTSEVAPAAAVPVYLRHDVVIKR